MNATCPTCGAPLPEHDRHIRYTWPDPVLESPRELDDDAVWMTATTPAESSLMQVEGIAPFVRALLPVQLDGGYTVTYGVWVGVAPDDLQHAFRVWWEPEYRDLALDGFLGNRIPPWDLLGTPLRIEVRDVDRIPYVTSSPHPELARVLSDTWPHGDVLAALPGA